MKHSDLKILKEDQYLVLQETKIRQYHEHIAGCELLDMIGQLKKAPELSPKEQRIMKKFQQFPIKMIVPKGAITQGSFHDLGALRIEGEHQGDVTVKDTLLVTGSGCLKGSVSARRVVCEGQITGDLNVQGSVRLHSGGVLRGRILTHSLEIEEGGVLNGECRLDRTKEKSASRRKIGMIKWFLDT